MPKRMRSSSRGFKRRRPYQPRSKRPMRRRTGYRRYSLNQPNAFKIVLQERNANQYNGATGWNHVAIAVNASRAAMANWDKYSTMFSKFRVDQFRVSMQFSQISVGSNPIRLYMWADDKATCTDENEALARPFVKARIIPADNSSIRMSMIVRPWTVLGITRQHYYNDDYYSASTASQPSKLAYFHYAYVCPSGNPNILKLERFAQLYKFYNRVERTS